MRGAANERDAERGDEDGQTDQSDVLQRKLITFSTPARNDHANKLVVAATLINKAANLGGRFNLRCILHIFLQVCAAHAKCLA